MFTFKFNNHYYTAYAQNEKGNPHEKNYPCLFDLATETIPVKYQKGICRDYLTQNNLDYHEVIHYAEKDINSYDMVNALLKFHKAQRI